MDQVSLNLSYRSYRRRFLVTRAISSSKTVVGQVPDLPSLGQQLFKVQWVCSIEDR